MIGSTGRTTPDREALQAAWLALKEARESVQRLQAAEAELAEANGLPPWDATVSALEEIGLRLELAELDARKALNAAPSISLQGWTGMTFT